MSRDLKMILRFLAKAAAIVFVVDFLIGTSLDYLHGQMQGGERARAYYAINESNSDIYVFGSSRALYHYHPLILQDSLNMTAYNAGRSAQTVLYHLPVLKMILKRHTPKMVILDINENEFVKEQRKYDLVNSLLPYYKKDEGVRTMVDLVKPGYRYFSWSRTLPYNSSFFAIMYRVLVPEKTKQDINGYIFVKGQRQHAVREINNCDESFDFDPKIIDAFEEFVKLCRLNDIKIFVVTSPRFATYECERKDLNFVRKKIQELNLPYLDLSSEKKYIENESFLYDAAHLNFEGSVEFTQDVASFVKFRDD